MSQIWWWPYWLQSVFIVSICSVILQMHSQKYKILNFYAYLGIACTKRYSVGLQTKALYSSSSFFITISGLVCLFIYLKADNNTTRLDGHLFLSGQAACASDQGQRTVWNCWCQDLLLSMFLFTFPLTYCDLLRCRRNVSLQPCLWQRHVEATEGEGKTARSAPCVVSSAAAYNCRINLPLGLWGHFCQNPELLEACADISTIVSICGGKRPMRLTKGSGCHLGSSIYCLFSLYVLILGATKCRLGQFPKQLSCCCSHI